MCKKVVVLLQKMQTLQNEKQFKCEITEMRSEEYNKLAEYLNGCT